MVTPKVMFRSPKLIKCEPLGDADRYLWVMEPELGRIFGKAFQVSATMILRNANANKMLKHAIQEAFEEMIVRSEFEIFVMEEGSPWEAFL